MTMTEAQAKLAELEVKVNELVKLYNDAYQNSDFNAAAKIDEEIEKAVNEYTATARAICFDTCKNSDDPMLTAVVMYSYEVLGVKDKELEDGTPVREVIKKDKQIDLLKLHKHCGSIGADKNWVNIAQKMNMLLTLQKCIDLGVDPKTVNDSYAMSDLAKQVDMGKTPTSKTKMLETLQMLVSAMVGEDKKAVSHDVNYLLTVYARKNGRKQLSVTCANHANFVKYIMDICHRIVTGKVYDVDYKVKKS